MNHVLIVSASQDTFIALPSLRSHRIRDGKTEKLQPAHRQTGENAQYKKPVAQPTKIHITTYKEYQSKKSRIKPRSEHASRQHRKYRPQCVPSQSCGMP